MPPEEGTPAERFRHLDGYRVQREWARYEGTAQRDLFRELRQRFVARHRGTPGPVADLGAGPGRFSDALGPSESPRVLLDLAQLALLEARNRARRIRRTRGPWGLVRGDARAPPLRPGRFGTVALLGNVVGFAESDAGTILRSAARLLRSDGTLLLEYVAGPGEHSVYLHRLPPTACRRTVRGPRAWLLAKVRSEGFAPDPPRKISGGGAFRRLRADRVDAWLASEGLEVAERLAVAPATGSEPERVEAIRADAEAWSRLLALEESLGRDTDRQPGAAAVLVAAVRRAEPGRRPKINGS